MEILGQSDLDIVRSKAQATFARPGASGPLIPSDS